MKEIKFRAWDDDENRYYYSHPGRTEDHYSGDLARFFECVQRYGHVIEQYTGLTDRNGSDVYKGDILRHIDSISVVEYGGADFAGYTINEIDDSITVLNDYGLASEEAEIIGNIHETPEKLEESK